MGGHYEKGLFNQLMEVQARLEAVEEAHKKDRKEVQSLTKEVKHSSLPRRKRIWKRSGKCGYSKSSRVH